ncbi:hypothetical protein Chor_002620 [Crotalus horridus]
MAAVEHRLNIQDFNPYLYGEEVTCMEKRPVELLTLVDRQTDVLMEFLNYNAAFMWACLSRNMMMVTALRMMNRVTIPMITAITLRHKGKGTRA